MDRTRLADYKTNLAFYNGQQWKDGEKRQDLPWIRRMTFNYAKVLVDKVTSYLMSELNYAVDPLDTGDAAKELAKRAEAALYRVQDANALSQLDFDTEIDTAVLGDGAYKVIWDPTRKDVKISAPDVQGLYAWHMGDDLSNVWRVASKYSLSKDDVAMLYKLTPPKATSTVVEVWTAANFELWVDEQRIRSGRNPYGVIPVIIYPNIRKPKEFWGVSDLPDLLQPTRELNRALSQLSMILELSGNPIAVLENVDKADDITVQPGAVWEIPEKAKAYLLDLLQGGGVKLHVDYIDLIYRTIHDLSESPKTSFGQNERALSGVALEMELHPLLQKIKRKRLIRTVVYRRRAELILRILAQHREFDQADLARLAIRIIWGPVLPQDRARLVEEETKLVIAGVHNRKTAADNLGVRDPEAEFAQWLTEEKNRLAIQGPSSPANTIPETPPLSQGGIGS